MKNRSISKCCKAQVKVLQGANITLCLGYTKQCPAYHEKQRTLLFQCTKCRKATKIIAGQITEKEAQNETPISQMIFPLPNCDCSIFHFCDFAKQHIMEVL